MQKKKRRTKQKKKKKKRKRRIKYARYEISQKNTENRKQKKRGETHQRNVALEDHTKKARRHHLIHQNTWTRLCRQGLHLTRGKGEAIQSEREGANVTRMWRDEEWMSEE